MTTNYKKPAPFIITAKIDRMMDNPDSKIRAIASATIGGQFAVHGIRVLNSQKGVFVQVPQNSYQKRGKTEYTDIFHPVTAEAQAALNDAVLAAYQEQLNEMAYAEELPFAPSM